MLSGSFQVQSNFCTWREQSNFWLLKPLQCPNFGLKLELRSGWWCTLLNLFFLDPDCSIRPIERLFHAVRSRNSLKVNFLLRCQETDINHIDEESGETALLVACKKGYLEIIELILGRQDIDPNISSTQSGNTPLHVAADKGNAEMAKLPSEIRVLDNENKDENFDEIKTKQKELWK